MSLLYVNMWSWSASGAVHFIGIRPCMQQVKESLKLLYSLSKDELSPYALLSVVLLLWDIPGHTKVSNLEHESFSYQDVASSQVAVDNLKIH